MSHAADIVTTPRSAAAFQALARAWCASPADLALVPDPARPVPSIDALLQDGLRDDQGQAPQPQDLAGWTAGQRLDALLRLCLARGLTQRLVTLRCAQPDCAADFDAELDLAALRQAPGEARLLQFNAVGQHWRARLPTGADQARWSQQPPPPEQLAAELLQPAPDQAPDDHLIAALDQALAEHDPLRLLRLDLACPECGHEQPHDLELEPLLLSALAQTHQAWLSDIARLARAFHWSEAEIAALPAWRRRFYLQQLDHAALASWERGAAAQAVA